MSTDLTGKVFSRLTVVELDDTRRDRWNRRLWKCACVCGKITFVTAYRLTSGNTKSCGCLSRDSAKDRFTKHGQNPGTGMTPEYRTWGSMLHRCQPGKTGRMYKHHGERGIQVCERWKDFRNFFADMGRKPSPRHSIDRIDSKGNYEPENFRWATPEQQARNSENARLNEEAAKVIRFFTHPSRRERKTLPLLARLHGVSYCAIKNVVDGVTWK